MNAKPTPTDLADPGRYVSRLSMTFDQIPEVASKLLREWTPVTFLYWALNLVAAGGLGYQWVRSGRPFPEVLEGLGLGIFATFVVLLPLHEWVHALAYRAFGATETRVVYRLRNLTAYCTADGFVAKGREFAVICLAPFVVINGALVLALAAVGGFVPFLWGMLIFHIAACSGDVAFANLTWLHRRETLYTWDDAKSQRTEFVLAKPPAEATAPVVSAS